MKGVDNDTAANAVLFACETKFPRKPSDEKIEMNADGQRVCRVYWVGNKFLLDSEKKRKAHTRYSIVHYENYIEYYASIPDGMAKDLNKRKGGIDAQLPQLLNKHMTSIQTACNIQ